MADGLHRPLDLNLEDLIMEDGASGWATVVVEGIKDGMAWRHPFWESRW
jgi:hypothetical protein